MEKKITIMYTIMKNGKEKIYFKSYSSYGEAVRGNAKMFAIYGIKNVTAKVV